MRLLQRDDTGKYSLTPDLAPSDVPPYAILSHTWGSDEVVYGDLAKPEDEWQHKPGYGKIKFCAEQAKRHGIQYFWVDTCCIDKSNSIELQTAINSMFRWYRDANQCYVYLADVSKTVISGPQQIMAPWEADFRNSRWFTRGWTLQELIAPKKVDFYSKEWSWLGNKKSLEHQICEVTNIPIKALQGAPLSDFTVLERQTWASNRQTKHEEDIVYSLSGIFGVYMTVNYGEGREYAQRRLREEIQKATQGTHMKDFSITLSMSDVPEIPYFVAREGELAKMRKALRSDEIRHVVTLHGLGGIGKTQLAVAYIKRYRNEYSAILWLNIKDEASIQESFSKVARQILQQHPKASYLSGLEPQQNAEEVVEAVKAWLSLPDNDRWLLVYDNYDNPKSANRTDHGEVGEIDIKRFFPETYQGSIIITSRSSQINIGCSIQIKKLELKDGLEILSTTSDRANLQDDVDARKLVKELDGLPLALATAGAYLRRVAISPDTYLRIYKESWAKLHISTPSLGSYQDRTLCSTWQLSYEQVQKQNSLAAHLLRWWAYFDNEDIWFELVQPNGVDDKEARIDSTKKPPALRRIQTRFRAALHPRMITGSHGTLQNRRDTKLPQSLAWTHELTDELKFLSAMSTLGDYGLVESHTITPDLVGYSIHSCVHAWTIHIVNKDRDARLAKFAVKCVAACVLPSQDDAQFWLLQRRLLSHAIRSCAMIQDSDQDLAWAFHNLGNLYSNQGRLVEAEDMYLRALQGYEKVCGPGHTSILDTVNNLGVLYKKQGKLVEAEGMYLRALRGYEKVYGPDDPLTLDIVNNLGNLYTNQGKLVEAEVMYIRALRGYEKVYGPDHKSTLNTVNNLSVLYKNQGKLVEAEGMCLRVLRGKEKAWGPDHPLTLDIVNNLGNLYTNQGKLAEAEDMYKRALQGKEEARGPDHTSTLDTVNNLGLLYANRGKLVEAEGMYLRALRGYEKAWGPDHTSTLSIFNNLGVLYRNQGKQAEAEDLYLRALQGYEKVWGLDHKSTLDTVNNLGILYDDQGKLVEAEVMYLRALRGYEKVYGLDHTSTLDTVNNLGVLYKNQGKLAEAKDMYLRALRGKEKAWGPDHTSTLDTVNNLGLLYASQGKLVEAEDMYLRALRGNEKAWGPDHTLTLDTVNNLGLLYANQGKLVEAEGMYLRALRGYEKAIGYQNISRYRPAINITWGLGTLLWDQGKLAEAKEYYQRAHNDLKVLLGPSHKNVQSLQNTLLDINKALEVQV